VLSTGDARNVAEYVMERSIAQRTKQRDRLKLPPPPYVSWEHVAAFI